MLTEELKHSLNEQLKERFDTYLSDNVITWLEALQQQGFGITIEQIAFVCRYANWLEVSDALDDGEED